MVDNTFGASECVPQITAFCFTVSADALGPRKLQNMTPLLMIGIEFSEDRDSSYFVENIKRMCSRHGPRSHEDN